MRYLIIILTVLAMVGCSSERTANKTNFSNAINRALNKQKVCFSDKSLKFPQVILETADIPKAYAKKLDALHHAGLLTRTKVMKQPKGAKGMSINMVRAYRYELTLKGYDASKLIRDGKTRYRRFCFAQRSAAAINSFSKPVEKNGKTTADVTFQYSLTKVKKWARDKKFVEAFPSVKKEIAILENPVEKTATLTLTEKRWVMSK